jgi:hypothetical protein
MRSTGCVLLSFLLLAACGPPYFGPPVMQATAEEDASAKAFVDPSPSMSAVYIYRAGHYAWAWPVDISLLGAVKTTLPVDTYVRADMAPGLNEVYCITNALPDRRRVELMADRVRYFQVTVNRGEFGPFCLVAEVAPEVGQAEVRRKRRIQPMWP